MDSIRNVILVDYTNLETQNSREIEDLLQIDRSVRNGIEANVSEKVAKEVIARLPQNESDIEGMIQTGFEIAKNMSWEAAVSNYLLVSLQKALDKQHSHTIIQT